MCAVCVKAISVLSASDFSDCNADAAIIHYQDVIRVIKHLIHFQKAQPSVKMQSRTEGNVLFYESLFHRMFYEIKIVIACFMVFCIMYSGSSSLF